MADLLRVGDLVRVRQIRSYGTSGRVIADHRPDQGAKEKKHKRVFVCLIVGTEALERQDLDIPEAFIRLGYLPPAEKEAMVNENARLREMVKKAVAELHEATGEGRAKIHQRIRAECS